MRKLAFFLPCILFFINCFSQNEEADSLLALLNSPKTAKEKTDIYNQVAVSYFNTSPENAIKYASQAKDIAEADSYKKGLAYALKNIGIGYYMQGDHVQTLTYWNQSLEEFNDLKDKKGIANVLSNLGAVYYDEGDDATALDHYLKALKYAEETGDTLRIVTLLNNIGAVYFHKPSTHDKALNYYLKALPLSEAIKDDDLGTIAGNIGEIYLERGQDTLALLYFKRSATAYENSNNYPYSLNNIGRVYEKRKDYTTALQYHQQALQLATKLSAKLDISQSYLGLATVYASMKDEPDALAAYKNAEAAAKEISASYALEKIYRGMAETYAGMGKYADAYKYQSLLIAIKDTLYNAENDKKLALLKFNFDLQQKQTEIDMLTKDKTLRDLDIKRQAVLRNSLIAVLSLVVLIAFVLFRNYRIKAKTTSVLNAQKQQLEKTLDVLKTTQNQLVQSEKMASLGELTAGVAHEIQNPLNFVNNFSEINREMIAEMREAIDKGDFDEVKILADDIDKNQEKIANHGKRADAIVKNMLQHSRKNTGQKELTDINALCDEYLRLSYHGLRAKDKSFNAETKTNFDESIGKLSIVPQDVGRVLLNLFNNAFYAVNEKQKTAGGNYNPVITVTTQKIMLSNSPGVKITIADNGNGIPQTVIDKIFHPFFTTKPAGQGTGLGLSLSYDIIKAHGGSIDVKTTEGKGTEFIIQLQ